MSPSPAQALQQDEGTTRRMNTWWSPRGERCTVWVLASSADTRVATYPCMLFDKSCISLRNSSCTARNSRRVATAVRMSVADRRGIRTEPGRRKDPGTRRAGLPRTDTWPRLLASALLSGIVMVCFGVRLAASPEVGATEGLATCVSAPTLAPTTSRRTSSDAGGGAWPDARAEACSEANSADASCSSWDGGQALWRTHMSANVAARERPIQSTASPNKAFVSCGAQHDTTPTHQHTPDPCSMSVQPQGCHCV